MPKPSSHYDTLGVVRDAPAEAIRNAYKALARRHHPDRNSNSPESHRQMQVLNAAFEVLNDPVNRAAHDQWLKEQERASLPPLSVLIKGGERIVTRYAAPSPESSYPTSTVKRRATGWILSLAIIVPVSWLAFAGRDNSPPAPFTVPAEPKAEYVRPSTTPKGLSWPTFASELAGYATSHDDGTSEIVFDNSQGPTDVFAELINVDGPQPAPARHVFLPARSRYHLTRVRMGTYEVAYQNLSTGAQYRSDRFEVIETKTAHSFMTIRLGSSAAGTGPAAATSDKPF